MKMWHKWITVGILWLWVHAVQAAATGGGTGGMSGAVTLPGVAAGMGGAAMDANSPIMGPLFAILNFLTGPIAVAVTLIGLIVGGAALIFGRTEMTDFMKTVFNVTVIGCLMIMSTNFITFLYGATVDPALLLAAANGSADMVCTP